MEKEGCIKQHGSVGNTARKVLLRLTEASVFKRLEELNVNKSPGPDGLPLRVLKKLGSLVDHYSTSLKTAY